jgi:hypothetical protein
VNKYKEKSMKERTEREKLLSSLRQGEKGAGAAADATAETPQDAAVRLPLVFSHLPFA